MVISRYIDLYTLLMFYGSNNKDQTSESMFLLKVPRTTDIITYYRLYLSLFTRTSISLLFSSSSLKVPQRCQTNHHQSLVSINSKHKISSMDYTFQVLFDFKYFGNQIIKEMWLPIWFHVN